MSWPTPGGDFRTWGTKLLAILQNSHNADGSIKDSVKNDLVAEIVPLVPAGAKGDQGEPGEGLVELPNSLGVVGGFMFDADTATSTSFGADGKPVPEATALIAGALTDEGYTFGGGAVDSVNGATGAVVLTAEDVGASPGPVALNSAWGDLRSHPRLSKPLSAPVLTYADQSANSLYWPWLVDMTPSGGSGVALMYSTDHDGAANPGGLYTANASSPTGTYTDQGLAYADSVSGGETETPAVIWDEADSHYHVYYQQAGSVGIGVQGTLLATSPDLVTFTRVGVVADMIANTEPGDGHTGYFFPFRYGGTWFAYSLYGGTISSRTALWQSADGETWYQHPIRLGRNIPQIDHLTGWDVDWRAGFSSAHVLWRGRPWLISLIREVGAGGGSIDPGSIFATPLSDDLRHFAARPVDITPDAQAWEQGGINQLGNALGWDGHLYIPYRAGDDETTNAAFGILEVI